MISNPAMPRSSSYATIMGGILLAIGLFIGLAAWAIPEAYAMARGIADGTGIGIGISAGARLLLVSAAIILIAFTPYFIAACRGRADGPYLLNLAIIISPWLLDSFTLPLIAWLALLVWAITRTCRHLESA